MSGLDDAADLMEGNNQSIFHVWYQLSSPSNIMLLATQNWALKLPNAEISGKKCLIGCSGFPGLKEFSW